MNLLSMLYLAIASLVSTTHAKDGIGAFPAHRNENLEKIAIQAATEKGCLNNPQGSIVTKSRTVSSCFAGGFVVEVLVSQNCENVECEYDGWLSKVTFTCDDMPSSIKCKRPNML